MDNEIHPIDGSDEFTTRHLGAEEAKRLIEEDSSSLDVSSPERMAYNLDRLREAGENIDVASLISQLEPMEVYANFDRLLRAGADPDAIAARMLPEFVGFRLAELKAAGAKNIDLVEIASKMEPETALIVVDTLRKRGDFTDSYALASNLDNNLIAIFLPDLQAAAEYGVARQITQAQADTVARLHFNGTTLADISTQLGLSAQTVKQELTARGLTPRQLTV